jgi:CsoR family transcriptional regulator, copper-sensing transcriptional repressor
MIRMEDLDKRISRILGQLKGIQKMVKEDRECPDILQQVSAVKKAIDGLSKEIVILYLEKSLPQDQLKNIKNVVERAINL